MNWLRALSPPIQAALLMLAAALLASLLNVLLRILTQELHPFEVAFFRNFVGLLVMLPLLGRHWITALRTRMRGRIAVSSVGHLVSMLCYFTAVAHLPLAEVIALSFTKPLFTTIGAALVLHEVVRGRRWGAVGVGFLGVLIVLQPGAATLSPYSLLVLLSTVSIASVTLMIKRMTATDTAVTIVLWQSMYLSLFSLPLAVSVWQWPQGDQWLLLGLTGVIATVSWLCMTRAFGMVDASSLMPYEFARLPLTAAFAYMLFAEVPTIWTWIGGAVIFASTAYITHREARLRAQAVRDGRGPVSPPELSPASAAAAREVPAGGATGSDDSGRRP